MGTTAVFAKVIHMGIDYATIQLTAQIHDNKNPENHLPTETFDVPKGIGEWLERIGATA